MVERRLERLVLDQHRHRRRHRPVDLLEGFREAALAGPDVVLARIVRAVCEPEREVPALRPPAQFDRIEAVLNRPPAHLGVPVSEAAIFIALVLEDVGVDRPDPHARLFGALRDLLVESLREVPEHVDRDARADAGEPVHLAGVGELVFHRPGGGRLMKLAEPRPGIRVAPRRRLDRQCAQPAHELIRILPALRRRAEHPFRVLRSLSHRHASLFASERSIFRIALDRVKQRPE
jgi:hypothetical protein